MAWRVSDRRRFTTWLAATVLGGLVGYAYVYIAGPMMFLPSSDPAAAQAFRGFRVGIMIAGLAVGFELYGMRTRLGAWLRGLSFLPAFLLRGVILATIIVTSLSLNVVFSRWLAGAQPIFHYPVRDLLIDAIFSFAVSELVLFVIQMRQLIGARTLTNILLGRYHRPVREERLFAVFDLKGSTRTAAQIGDERFHGLLSTIFADADRTIVDGGGEVHAYVGDAMITTWPLGTDAMNGRAVAAAFDVLDGIARRSPNYRKRFGVTPRFRVALHGGPVIAGECGDSKRQITYLGDTLNVTARLEQLAKIIDVEFIVSADILPRLALPPDVRVRDHGEHTVSGVAKPLRVYALVQGDQRDDAPHLSSPGVSRRPIPQRTPAAE